MLERLKHKDVTGYENLEYWLKSSLRQLGATHCASDGLVCGLCTDMLDHRSGSRVLKVWLLRAIFRV